jgi:hypothetical protein
MIAPLILTVDGAVTKQSVSMPAATSHRAASRQGRPIYAASSITERSIESSRAF